MDNWNNHFNNSQCPSFSYLLENIMKSPCIGVCKIDDNTDLCKGCYRTLEEIKQWSKMCELDREKIAKKIIFRKSRQAFKKLGVVYK